MANYMGFDPGPLISGIGSAFASLPLLRQSQGFLPPERLGGVDWGNIAVAGNGFAGPSLVMGPGFQGPRLVGNLQPFGAGPLSGGGTGSPFGVTVLSNNRPFGSGYIPPNIPTKIDLPAGTDAGSVGAVPGEGFGSPDAAALDRELGNGAMRGQGATILAAANRHGVPVSMLMAIFRAESSYDVPAKGTRFNFGGLKGEGGTDVFADYSNIAAGIDAVAANLGSQRYRGLTVAQVINTWAPASDGNAPEQYITNALETIRRLGGNATRNSVVVGSATPSSGSVVATARQLIGTPYQLGGLRSHPENPRAGLDCSEFTAWVYKRHGKTLTWNAQAQYNETQRVTAGDVQVGDLVFFTGTNANDPDHITHVGIYIGNGMMINAQDDGVKEVSIVTGYWRSHIAGYGRVR